jgi:hypothetical protein
VPDLAGTVDAIVLRVDLLDQRGQLVVAAALAGRTLSS